MRRTYKYRLYPTKPQERQLRETLELCRWVYNETLATRKTAWEERQESLSLYDTKAMLPAWKAVHPELRRVHAQVLQDVSIRVDRAFGAFFRRVQLGEKEAGYPRFKGKGRYDSLTYPQYGNGVTLGGSQLTVSKIGTLYLKRHRPIDGTIKTVTIRRASTGKWWVCFSVEIEPTPLPASDAEVGIDVGLASFATLSTGNPNDTIPNPRFFRHEEQELAKAQRKLALAEKGTVERAKRRQVVARIHERIANKRQNFIHQATRQLIDRFGAIYVEDLTIKHMVRNHCLAKSSADAAWGLFVQVVAYKAADAGRHYHAVDPRHTSQRCSGCSRLVPKPLSERVHRCPHADCGLVLDRDYNAALNILALGRQGQGIAHEAQRL